MEPVRKELDCPSCGKKAVVRVMPGGTQHRWQCPDCHKMQTTDNAAAEAAPPASP
jgi:transposase-like protein